LFNFVIYVIFAHLTTLSYQILPNTIFLLAILGILILILRRLPEAKAESEKQDLEIPVETKLANKGLPALAISKIKVQVRFVVKKIWQFILEAKDLRPHALASYKIKKIFEGRLPLSKKAVFQTAHVPEPENEQYLLEKIKHEPKNLANYDALGKFYLDRNNFTEAKDIYLYLTNHEPSSGDYQAKLAYCFFQLDDFEKAAQHYQNSLALDPAHPNRYYNLGLSLASLGRFADAVKHYEQAIALEPKSVKYYLVLSEAHVWLGNAQQAKEALLKAKEIDPIHELVNQKLNDLLK
jgi:tetratricopeptide (TPR) repeat protein